MSGFGSKERTRMSTERNDAATGARGVRRTIAALVAALALIAVMASSASAAPEFAEFVVGSSNTQAGGHPDLNVRMRLENAGRPRGRARPHLQPARRASSATRARSSNARRPTSRSTTASPAPRSASISDRRQLRRQPEHDPRHGSGLQHEDDREDETARLAFVAPTGQHPDRNPDHGPQRLRLRAADDRADASRRRSR